MMKRPSFRHSIATIGLLAIDGLCAQTISPTVRRPISTSQAKIDSTTV